MTYTVIEWTWTLIAGIGLVASSVAYLQARGDVLFLLSKRFNGRRLIVARGHERREALRVLVQGLGLYVGIYSLTLPNPPGNRLSAAIVSLMLMQALVVLNTIFDHRDRNKLTRYWKNVDISHVAERDKELKEEL